MRDNVEVFLYLEQSSIDLEDKMNIGSWSYATLIDTYFIWHSVLDQPLHLLMGWSWWLHMIKPEGMQLSEAIICS